MNMTPRDRNILLAFSLVVVVCAAVAIVQRTSGGSGDSGPSAKPSSDSRVPEGARRPAMASGETAELARNVFRPLVAGLPSDRALAAPGPSSSPAAKPPSAATKSTGRGNWRSPTSKGPDGGGGDGAGKSRGEPIKIALVGITNGPNGPRALVENEKKESRYVALNEDAFGYTLSYLAQTGAIFSQNDRYYVLKLGEGKQVVEAPPPAASNQTPDTSKAGASPGAGGPSPTMSFDASMMSGPSPEMMMKWQSSGGEGRRGRRGGRNGAAVKVGF